MKKNQADCWDYKVPLKLFERLKPGEHPQLFERLKPGEHPQLFIRLRPAEDQNHESGELVFAQDLKNDEPCSIRQDIRGVFTQDVNETRKQSSDLESGGVEKPGNYYNFSLRLIEIVEKRFDTFDGEKSKKVYVFEIFVDGRYYESVVKADDVANFRWVKTASEGRAFIRKGVKGMAFDEYVSAVINESNPTSRIEYASNGWKKINGTRVYVIDSGAVGKGNFPVKGNGKYRFEFTPEMVGKIETFHQAMGMLDICNDKKITLPLFVFTHCGVLSTLFDEAGCPIKFIPAVIGETNSRKTSLTLCMTKTFNRKAIQIPEVTFNSTEGGIEKNIGLHADAVLVIDDFMPALTATKQRLLDDKLEKIVRMCGDRKGIERMSDFARNPNAGYYPVRGVAVITGEHYKGVQSSLSRSLIIRLDRNSVDNDKLGFYQKNYRILNTHLYDFLKVISDNYENVIEIIRQKIEEYRKCHLFDLPRYNEIFAVLLTTSEIFLKYAYSRGFLTDYQCRVIWEEWCQTFKDLLLQNEMAVRKQEWPTIFAQVCAEIISNGAEPLPQVEMKDYGDVKFENEDFFFLRLESFLKEMKRLLRLWGIECPNMTKQYILTELEKSGLIETKGKAEGKRTLKLPGSKVNQQRFLYLRKEKIKQMLEKMEG